MSAIPSPVQTVLDLFSSELTDVRFGDVDAQTLAIAGANVASAAQSLASAEALVAEARSALQERQEILLQHAQRALAYARVYAETNAGLAARLEAITLPRSARRARPDVLVLSPDPPLERRPRGRPRKTPAAQTGDDALLDATAAE